DAKLVIMDEPTASLTRHEVDGLMAVVADLQKKGIATVFVSHRLNEVMEIAERVTVLRDGKRVGTYDARQMNHHKLAFLMTGQEFRYDFHDGPVSQAAPVVEVRHLTKEGQYHDVSLTVREGEIVGLTGLLGSGRTELALSLFGMNPPDSGEALLGGRPLRLASNRDAIRQGIAYVSEDRLGLRLVMDQSIGTNMTLTILGQLVDWSGPDRRTAAEHDHRSLDPRPAHQGRPSRRSGEDLVGRQSAAGGAGEMGCHAAQAADPRFADRRR